MKPGLQEQLKLPGGELTQSALMLQGWVKHSSISGAHMLGGLIRGKIYFTVVASSGFPRILHCGGEVVKFT